MMFYYFTSAKYGIENLHKQRLKISDFSNVNDPFELLGVALDDKDVRAAVNFEKTILAKTKGLICFSERKDNPVQWAHYADNHRGICLGFEIPEIELKKVRYVSERLAKETLNQPDFNEKLLITKFKHWEYEKERRLIFDLANYPADGRGLHFKSFDGNLILKEVCIGCKSDLEISDIFSAYSPRNKMVIVKKFRPSFREFRIVWDKGVKSVRL